jgi:hypothetical protein
VWLDRFRSYLLLTASVQSVKVGLSFNFLLCWGYTRDRENRVSGEASVMLSQSSSKSRDRGEKMIGGGERERERER